MLRKNRLFTPGPTPLLPAAQTAMASFTAHHRTTDFRALFQRERDDLRAVLTPDQQKTFDRNMEEMRQRRSGGP